MKTLLIIVLLLPFVFIGQTKTKPTAANAKTKTVQKTVSKDSVGSKPAAVSTPQKDYKGLYLLKNGVLNKLEEITCYDFNVDSLVFILEIENEFDVYDRIEFNVHLTYEGESKMSMGNLQSIKQTERGSGYEYKYLCRLAKFDYTSGKWSKRKYMMFPITDEKQKQRTYDNSISYTSTMQGQMAYNSDSLKYKYELRVVCNYEIISGYTDIYDPNTGNYTKTPKYETKNSKVLFNTKLRNQEIFNSGMISNVSKKKSEAVMLELKQKGHMDVRYSESSESVYYGPTEIKKGCANKFSETIGQEAIRLIMRK